MTTLAEATLDLARILTNVVESTATGGSTTTLVDSARYEQDNYFKNNFSGTIWFLSGDNSGASAIITDWDLATTTFTFATQSNAIANGNRYAACPQDWPRYVLIQAVNEAIKEQPARDTSLTTTDDTLEYSLPAGVYNVKRVEVAGNQSSPYDYVPHYQWRELEDKLVFDENTDPTGGYTIRLTYVANKSELTADSDSIDNLIYPDRLKWVAAVHAWRWYIRMVKDDQIARVMLNEALVNAERYKQMYPIPGEIIRDPRHSGW